MDRELREAAPPLEASAVKVEFADVGKRFGETVALEHATLTVRRGESVAVIGPSGSGKTTLLRLAARLDEPSSGAVDLEVEGAERPTRLEQSRRACLVLQKPVMLKRTVFENVAYAPRVRGVPEGEVEARVISALDELGIREFEDRYAARLSGGQQQRVALARAFAARPDLLLLDEFTANLDPANSRVAEAAVSRYRKNTGATLLFSSHNPHQAKRLADRVALMIDGRLLEVAPTGRFFTSPERPETRAFLAGEIPY
ncbi:MAG: phosphate ABC transporter ATP-binding protein [Candidatus Rokuibacteriota bacterium]